MNLFTVLGKGPPYEWSGRFRRADLPEEWLRGILTVEAGESPRLRLFGRFSDTHPFSAFVTWPRPEWTLTGYVEDGQHITIVRGWLEGGRAQAPGAVELHLRAAAVVLGDRHIDPESDVFTAVEITYDDLGNVVHPQREFPLPGWQPLRTLERIGLPVANIPEELESKAYVTHLLGYRQRPGLTARVPKLGRIAVDFEPSYGPSADGVGLSESGQIKIELPRGLTLFEIEREVRVHFDRLLSLALDTKVSHRILRLRLRGRKEQSVRDRRRGTDDRLLFVVTGREAKPPDERRSTIRVALQFSAANFEQIVQTWILLHRGQRRALNYFFETAYTHDPFVDRGLMTAIQAVEGYHRADNEIPERERKQFEAQRLRAAQLAEEASLDPRVVSGPTGIEPNLADRINSLLDRQVPSNRTRRQRASLRRFSQRVAELRNGLAHLLDRIDSFTVDEMYEQRQSLLALMKLELLERLGSTVEEREWITRVMGWEPPPGIALVRAAPKK